MHTTGGISTSPRTILWSGVFVIAICFVPARIRADLDSNQRQSLQTQLDALEREAAALDQQIAKVARLVFREEDAGGKRQECFSVDDSHAHAAILAR